MDFPILDNGTRIGTLTVTREGLYTRFAAEIPAREGLQRLWLCSEQAAACLGLFTPEGDRLRLCRRLSRAELRALPAPLCYAALTAPPPKAEDKPDSDGFRRLRLGGNTFVTRPRGK